MCDRVKTDYATRELHGHLHTHVEAMLFNMDIKLSTHPC